MLQVTEGGLGIKIMFWPQIDLCFLPGTLATQPPDQVTFQHVNLDCHTTKTDDNLACTTKIVQQENLQI